MYINSELYFIYLSFCFFSSLEEISIYTRHYFYYYYDFHFEKQIIEKIEVKFD